MCCENDENENLPIFVYGTLRPGQRNYFHLEGCTLSEQPAYVKGLQLFSPGTYPMVRPISPIEASYATPESNCVYGNLMIIDPDCYDSVLHDLDRLENYQPLHPERSDYLRIAYDVMLLEGEVSVKAWVYVGTENLLNEIPCQRIWDGDWCAYQQSILMKRLREGE